MTCRMRGRDGRIQNLKACGETSPVYAAINQNVSIKGKERTVLWQFSFEMETFYPTGKLLKQIGKQLKIAAEVPETDQIH